MNTCLQCHSVYGDDYVYCLQCGTLLTAGAEQETVVRPRFDMPEAGGAMVACGGCGHGNRSGSKFCKTCGGPISAAPSAQPAGQPFDFATSAAPAFEPSGYQETVHFGQPRVFAPPQASNAPPQASSNRVLMFVGGGLAAGVLLLIALVVFIIPPPPSPNDNKKTPASTLPRNFDRSYKGSVLNPRKGTDLELTMALVRSDGELTGWVTTNRKTDEVRGTIDDDGEFELTAYENGQQHSGYWAGRILTDGTIENGQWMDKYKSESTSYKARQQ